MSACVPLVVVCLSEIYIYIILVVWWWWWWCGVASKNHFSAAAVEDFIKQKSGATLTQLQQQFPHCGDIMGIIGNVRTPPLYIYIYIYIYL